MNETLKNVYKKYVSDFHAIDKLQSDSIINEEETLRLKNKLLVDIICTFEREIKD